MSHRVMCCCHRCYKWINPTPCNRMDLRRPVPSSWFWRRRRVMPKLHVQVSAYFPMSAIHKMLSTWSEFSRECHCYFCRIVANDVLEWRTPYSNRTAGFKLGAPGGHETAIEMWSLLHTAVVTVCELRVHVCLLSREPQHLGFGCFVCNPLTFRNCASYI
jgi:hypothetical protein